MNRSYAVVTVVALSMAVFLGASCMSLESRQGWTQPKVVRIHAETGGKGGWQVLSPLLGPVFYGRDPAVLLRDGDCFGTEKHCIPYQSNDGPVLELSCKGVCAILGGNPVSLSLDKEGGWEWLAKATPEEMAALRLVTLGERAPPEGVDAEGLFKKLAASNPHIALQIVPKDKDASITDEGVSNLLALVDPEWLMLNGGPLGKKAWAALAREPCLRTLFLGEPDKDDLALLAALPHLETLYLGKWDVEKAGPLPDGLPHLRTLIVEKANMKDLACLGKQPCLEEVTVYTSEGLGDISALAAYPHLKTLCLRAFGDEKNPPDLAVLKQLKELRWLVLPPFATQKQFAEIVRDHPHLAVFEAVSAPDRVTDLTPLTALPELQALFINSAVAKPEVLRQLKHLKFLALAVPDAGKTDKETEEAEKAWLALHADLQKTLPDVTITRVIPFCLGSGYILLLVAGVAAAWALTARRARRGACAGSPHV